ncbi:SDR family NAD(P)-dependent oxidoreductase [Burkholderia gladioli]|jgi:3-oxoacyl-[acyl-carrier protein] reductase|uniref:SDR family NAD(P)-dependent oxidoreductase n=1 Tax=Burkholderia gladioli TaxID=28095 RepID=UPI000F8042F1|nr:SDR family oxidoreductase [Burkholderia gladioli]MBU9641156.1 SDR family oxidoreductase [Burkholderia gladioli]MDN7807386.1 SDR family oxidoreductase [Burkholderia gladioli]
MTTPRLTDNGQPVAVVTGATGGLGAQISRALAAAGFAVVAGYRSSAGAARSLVATLDGAGHCALAAPVTDSEALASLADTIATRYGRCDVLVNCAGTTRFVEHAHLDGLDDALIDDILATNIRGPFATVRALHPLLANSSFPGGAVVINISSIAAQTAMGSNVMYCASKAALDSLTKSLARALAPAIRVLSVSPGLVDTEFVKSMDVAWRNEQAARTPLGRLARPEEVAAAVVTAVRDLHFTTGCVLPVDGGRPLK